jgi:hypothetical protein
LWTLAGVLAVSGVAGCRHTSDVRSHHVNLPGRNFAAVGAVLDDTTVVFAGSAVAAGHADTGPDSWDAWIAAYDTDGTQRWQRLLGEAGYDTITGVVAVNGCVLAAGMDSTGTDPSVPAGSDAVLRRFDRDGSAVWELRIAGRGILEVGRIAASDRGTVLVAVAGASGALDTSFEPARGQLRTTTLSGAAAGTHFLEIDTDGTVLQHAHIPDAATIFDIARFGDGWIAGGTIGWNELERSGPGVVYHLDAALRVVATRVIPGTAVAVSGVWAAGEQVGVSGHYRDDVTIDGDTRRVPTGAIRGGFILNLDTALRTTSVHHLTSSYVVPHDGVLAPDGTQRIVGLFAGALRLDNDPGPVTSDLDDVDGFVLDLHADTHRFTPIVAPGHQALTSLVIGDHRWVAGAADNLPRAYWPVGDVVGGLDGIVVYVP